MNEKNDNVLSEELLEEVDIASTAGVGNRRPPARIYIITVDRQTYRVPVSKMTGRQILELSKHVPVEHWILKQKLHGGHVKTVGLNEEVDFCEPGIEKFMTLPNDQTEG